MKVTEVREMSIADLRDRIEIEKNNLDTMKLNGGYVQDQKNPSGYCPHDHYPCRERKTAELNK